MGLRGRVEDEVASAWWLGVAVDDSARGRGGVVSNRARVGTGSERLSGRIGESVDVQRQTLALQLLAAPSTVCSVRILITFRVFKFRSR